MPRGILLLLLLLLLLLVLVILLYYHHYYFSFYYCSLTLTFLCYFDLANLVKEPYEIFKYFFFLFFKIFYHKNWKW